MEIEEALDGTVGGQGVKVVCRVRPLLHAEARMDNTSQCVLCREDNSVVFRQTEAAIGSEDKVFPLSAAVGPEVSQAEFYNKHCRPLIRDLMKGTNVTIWTHGQTGAGKSHTVEGPRPGPGEEIMEGLKSEDGVFARAAHHIFKSKNRANGLKSFSATITMIQIHNGRIHDLLSKPHSESVRVRIRQEPNGEVTVVNCIERSAACEVVLKELFEEGRTNRDNNVFMSGRSLARSTCIYTIKIRQEYEDKIVSSRLNIVDSSGSERISKTGLSPIKSQEGTHLSSSMSSLGLCLAALNANCDIPEGGKKKFVPYRDCPVVHYLKDSLGGNTITMFVVCVSPSSRNGDETLSSLRFATRMARVVNKPTRNIEWKQPPNVKDAGVDSPSSGDDDNDESPSSFSDSPHSPSTFPFNSCGSPRSPRGVAVGGIMFDSTPILTTVTVSPGQEACVAPEDDDDFVLVEADGAMSDWAEL